MATDQEAFKIYLPLELAQQVRELAKAEDRTVTSIVRRALREYLAGLEAEAAA